MADERYYATLSHELPQLGVKVGGQGGGSRWGVVVVVVVVTSNAIYVPHHTTIHGNRPSSILFVQKRFGDYELANEKLCIPNSKLWDLLLERTCIN